VRLAHSLSVVHVSFAVTTVCPAASPWVARERNSSWVTVAGYISEDTPTHYNGAPPHAIDTDSRTLLQYSHDTAY